MPATDDHPRFFPIAVLLFSFLVFLPLPALGQEYPKGPITVYCGYAPGGPIDLTTRALARSAEKIMGVPVVVENKPGGGATVCAGLVASKKPDGYTLGIVSSGAFTIRPHLLKVTYDPLKDFTFFMHYARFTGGLCVLTESPIKTINELIAYAKAHPGMSYGSTGMYTADHLTMELFGKCKDLTFRHLPTKGEAEFINLLLGKHLDFIPGVGMHMRYVKSGTFRMLAVFYADKRDPKFPDIPTLREVGCEEPPTTRYSLFAPKGVPEPISQKIFEGFKKASEASDFQELLANLDIPYEFQDRTTMEKDIPVEFEWYKGFLKKMGAKKEG